MILLDYKDSRPLYEQISDKLAALILCGAFEPDSKLPSVRNLAVELSINPNTIQKAYADLERKGYVYTVKGKGNFVGSVVKLKEVKRQEILDEIYELVKQGKELGMSSDDFVKEIKKWYQEENND